ncbi:MAG: PEP-CTERM sorting domain-containing protein [Planctomycetota bacterium]
MKRTFTILTTSAALLAIACGAPVSGAVIATLSSEAPSGTTNDHTGAIQAVDGDLLKTVASVAAEGGVGDSSRHVTASMFNGMISTGTANGSNGGDVDSPTAAGYYGAGDFIEFDLDTSVNTLGYNISLIQVIQRGDSARPGINTTIFVREVGQTTFTELIAPIPAGTSGNVNMYAITNDSGPLVASGVDGIRFEFGRSDAPDGNTGGNAWTWYRELDVVGVPVPEPGSLALLAMGGLCLLRRRR